MMQVCADVKYAASAVHLHMHIKLISHLKVKERAMHSKTDP